MGGGSNEPPPSNPCDNVKAPINVQTGNVFFDQTDVSIPGIQGLVFTRSYNSKNAYGALPSDMSRGWTHSYGRYLSFPDAISIDFRGDDGIARYYQDPDADSQYQAVLPATDRSWLTREADGYRRHFRGGAYETYDLSGRLTSVVDVAGNATTLTRAIDGRLLRITDAGGRSILLTYDEDGRLSGVGVGEDILVSYRYNETGPHNDLESVRYPDGSGYDFIADANGQITRVSDASGRVVEAHEYGSYPYQSHGLTSELAGGREKITLTYDTLATTVTDVKSSPTKYDWAWIGGLRRVTKIAGPCPSCGGGEETKEWTYDSRGRVTGHQRTAQAPSIYTYDTQDHVTSVQDPLGRTRSYTYDAEGRLDSAATPGGGLVTYTYGLYGPLTITEKLSETTSRTTTYTYTALGQVHTVTDPRGKTTTYAYTAAGDLHTVTDPLDHTTTFEYDGLGRRTSVTDALGRTTTTTYDPRGRATRITSPDQTHTDFAYDLSGRRTSVTDPLGRVTRWVYDEYGRLGSVVDPLDGVTKYEYDLDGALTALTDAKGQTTSFGHDVAGRVNAVTYPGGAQETFTYDAAGRLATKTDRRAIVTTYAYDGLGRLTGKTYSNGDPAVSYTYDLAGRLQTAANGTDTLTWSYDLAGQLLSEQSARHGSLVSYTHDAAGNRLSLSLDGQLFLSYGYDDGSRLTSLTRGSQVFGFGYDTVNRRTSMSYPNAVTTSYAYDDVNRLTSLAALLNGTTPITSFAYTYDAAGNRLTKATPQFTETYGYDSLSRLSGVERTGSLSGLWHFDYDPVGNRTTAQTNSSVTTSSYNEKNQLTGSAGGGSLRVRGTLDEPGSATVNGQGARMLPGNVFEATIQASPGTNTFTVEATDTSGNVTSKGYQVDVAASGASYSYDASGNLAQKLEGSDTWTYEWNAEGQLKRVLKNGVEQARFSYDPIGRRVEKVAERRHNRLHLRRQHILREVRGSTTLRYVHGTGCGRALGGGGLHGAVVFPCRRSRQHHQGDQLVGRCGAHARIRHLGESRSGRDRARLCVHRQGVGPRDRPLLLQSKILRPEGRDVHQRGLSGRSHWR